jgi:hypothetical protein
MNHEWLGPALVSGNQSTTVWQLTLEELYSVLATGCVGVVVQGRQPPIAITALTIEQPAGQRLFRVERDGYPEAELATLQAAMAWALQHFAAGGQSFSVEVLTPLMPEPRECGAHGNNPDSLPNTCRLPTGHEGPHEYA